MTTTSKQHDITLSGVLNKVTTLVEWMCAATIIVATFFIILMIRDLL